jgi:hypothetical protein
LNGVREFMTIKQIYKKYEKVMDLLYNLEDDFFYESKTLGKVIELLQVLDLDKEFSLCETRAMNRKPCDNCGLMITELQEINIEKAYDIRDNILSNQRSCDECSLTISSYEYRKNKGLCNGCVKAIQ